MARVIISRCLGLDACRYNGERIDASWIVELVEKAEVISICPEMDIGLGISRLPINLIARAHNLGSGIFAALAREFFPEAVFVDECFMEKNGVEDLLRLIKQS